MLTFEKVQEIFQDYLSADTEIEILKSRYGYLRVVWDSKSLTCGDDVLCQTPRELFDVLLQDFETFQEIRLTKGKRDLTEEDRLQVANMCSIFIERCRQEERG